MKAFFTGFNFARFIILVCFIGALPLGWRAWEQYQANERMKQALSQGGRIEELVTRIQESSRTYTQLMRDRRSEGLIGAQADVQSYIRGKAFGDRVELGEIQIDPSRPRSVGNNMRDTNYAIRPMDRDSSFQRVAIANFLFTLEHDSQRVRVTEVSIRHENKRLKPEEIPDSDRWTFEAQITTREKVDE